MTSQFVDMTSSSNFFHVSVFILSSLVTDLGFMSISWLVLELWKFWFIKDRPEIRKSKIPPSRFCPIFRDWGQLEILISARMSLIKSYWMLQNARVTTVTVSELLRENQQWGKFTPQHTPPKKGKKICNTFYFKYLILFKNFTFY